MFSEYAHKELNALFLEALNANKIEIRTDVVPEFIKEAHIKFGEIITKFITTENIDNETVAALIDKLDNYDILQEMHYKYVLERRKINRFKPDEIHEKIFRKIEVIKYDSITSALKLALSKYKEIAGDKGFEIIDKAMLRREL